jgi:hypothetical protein
MLGNNLSIKLGLSALLFFGNCIIGFKRPCPRWSGAIYSRYQFDWYLASWRWRNLLFENIANELLWLDISGNDDGRSFSNVLKGRIHENNNTITADWADIPRGINEYYGQEPCLSIQMQSWTKPMRLAMMKMEIHLAVLAIQYGIDKVLLSSNKEKRSSRYHYRIKCALQL